MARTHYDKIRTQIETPLDKAEKLLKAQGKDPAEVLGEEYIGHIQGTEKYYLDTLANKFPKELHHRSIDAVAERLARLYDNNLHVSALAHDSRAVAPALLPSVTKVLQKATDAPDTVLDGTLLAGRLGSDALATIRRQAAKAPSHPPVEETLQLRIQLSTPLAEAAFHASRLRMAGAISPEIYQVVAEAENA